MEKKIGIAKVTDLKLCKFAYLSANTIRTVLWSNREAGMESAKHVAALPISHFAAIGIDKLCSYIFKFVRPPESQ